MEYMTVLNKCDKIRVQKTHKHPSDLMGKVPILHVQMGHLR